MARLIADESGQDLIEYALLAAFIAVTVAAIPFSSIRGALDGIFERVAATLAAATS